jgi:ADP-ribosylglycohydrolase
MNERIMDQIRGVVYGHAIGDALGLGTEFLSKTQVRDSYPEGLRSYSQIIQDPHRRRWPCGAWTDDTDQMLCIFDSLLEHKAVNPLDIADRLFKWALRGGIGIGKTVKYVVYNPGFRRDPHATAKKMWEHWGRDKAANGGVMRTSILGIWDYTHADNVRRNAEQVCKITHYDPRCVASCVAVCQAISALLRGDEDVQTLTRTIAAAVHAYDYRIKEYIDKSSLDHLEAFDLDEGLNPDEKNTIGYTLKTLGAGFWAMQHATSYRDGIHQIIHEGGDADTNAAVAGSLLGARFGFSNIPDEWVKGLAQETELYSRVDRLIALMDPIASMDTKEAGELA